MCGRYVMTRAPGDLLSFFDAEDPSGIELRPNWNTAPTQVVPIVLERAEDGPPERQLVSARWGLVPSWAKDVKIGSRMINARSETILEKPSFRSAAVKRRALVPADGYYEWQKTEDGKIPTYLHGDAPAPLAFAGLYEFWPDPELPEDHPEKWLLSCTILTTTAQDSLGHIHDRSPVVVPSGMFGDWLDPEATDKDDVLGSWRHSAILCSSRGRSATA
jgi:putative SOS response-associated peptidase YedK